MSDIEVDSNLEYSLSHTWRLIILSIAMVGTMTTWFAMTAVLPELTIIWSLNSTESSLITIMVQIGFVIGSLLSAFLNLPDRIQPSVLFFLSGILAGLSTILIVLFPNSILITYFLRFITGIALSGVYGPGLKIISTWFRLRRGMALGFVVGALTLGSAAPHLFRGFWSGSWEVVVLTAGMASVMAGILVQTFVKNGPYVLPVGNFDPRAILRIFRHKPVRLANYGYFGHMWELYAMWTWFGMFLARSLQSIEIRNAPSLSSILTFIVVGSGFFGAWFGGIVADRYGREWVTMWSLGISGFISIIIGFAFGASPWIIVVLGIIWGMSIIADSAQFSALITEHAEQEYVGSALTFQLAIGFAITILAIWLVPIIGEAVGWRFVFLILTPGPVLGFFSMYRLYRMHSKHTKCA